MYICRLLNPTKSQLGKISKQVLQNINKTLRSKLNANQWQNSSEVIDWFKNIHNKNLCTFTAFDIQEFYPSITEKLLKDTLAFAQRYINIEPNELELIFHARRSLLYCKDTAWVKKEGYGEFDVTMGSNDGAETCEIVGLFLLYSIGEIFNKKDIGLYRDDGLACFENNDGHQNDKIRKELIKIFQRNGLKLDIKCNLKVVDYLDITFDLKTGSYKPYRKPNNDTRYINSKSNHPPTILKQISTAISNRISTNSSNEEIFKNSAPYYNNILKESGYKEKLQFQPNKHHSTPRRNRSKNIIWFNPPYSINVETNVARRFLKLVKKHFSKHRYHKIFNKNNIKVSYSCMDNMEKLVKKHNSNILKKDDTMKRTCNCRVKNECPLDGKCLSSNIVYSAEVLIDNNEQGDIYFGISETEFKTRLNNHKKSFKNRIYETDNELSKYIWDLKDKNITNYCIKWSIAKQTSGYNSVTNSCSLCLSEKFIICNFRDKNRLINKRMDLVSKCRHENKFILSNYYY